MARKVLKQKVRHLRNEKQLEEDRTITNREIAESTGLTVQTVGRWMKDEVATYDPQVLLAFMQYFNCSVERILQVETVEN